MPDVPPVDAGRSLFRAIKDDESGDCHGACATCEAVARHPHLRCEDHPFPAVRSQSSWTFVLCETAIRLLCLLGVLEIVHHFRLPDWLIIPAVVPVYALLFAYRRLVTTPAHPVERAHATKNARTPSSDGGDDRA